MCQRRTGAHMNTPAIQQVVRRVAIAHVTQCPYCIASHTRVARIKGASDE